MSNWFGPVVWWLAVGLSFRLGKVATAPPTRGGGLQFRLVDDDRAVLLDRGCPVIYMTNRVHRDVWNSVAITVPHRCLIADLLGKLLPSGAVADRAEFEPRLVF